MEEKVIIGPPSVSFGWLNLVTLALFYAKVEKNMYAKWWIVLLPTNIFLVYSLAKVIRFLTRAQDMAGKLTNFEDIRLVVIWKFTQIIILSSMMTVSVFTGDYLQKIDDAETREEVNESLRHIIVAIAVIFFVYMGYSWACKHIIQDTYLPMKFQEEEEVGERQKVSITQFIMNSIMSIMGNTMTICAGGACNNIYLSTVSAFFTAFGIPIVEYIHYLSFIAFFFVAISLLSLYSVRNSCKYPPFILSAMGSALILTDLIFGIHNYLTYFGNILIIGGAIWNYRLNKFSFSKNRKKQNISDPA